MKKLTIILAFITVLGFSQSVKAQEPDATGFIRTYAQPGGMLSFDWIIGVPVGDMTDFISDVSTRGFNMEYRYFFNSPISVGGGFSWQGYSQKFDRSTYSTDGVAITATRFNYLYTFPIYVNFHYYPVKSNFLYPFVGINAGAYYVDKQDQIGRYYVQDENWQFGFQPEVGVLIKPNPAGGFGFTVKAKYNYILYNEGGYNNLTQLNIYLGAAFIF
ncbi:MAG: outer membrane beta-barrel protein [Bacteroidales bacterium]|nr:outer membrane beta-barrel protein [Bacteroidales bacterium]